jgi:hypothetical protein
MVERLPHSGASKPPMSTGPTSHYRPAFALSVVLLAALALGACSTAMNAIGTGAPESEDTLYATRPPISPRSPT